MPEARLNLAQATIHLALAPKSNAVLAAVETALADVRAGRTGTVPAHLRDSHYPGAKKLGHGSPGGYRYPHDFPGRVVAQQYAPDPVVGREYYSPSGLGVERVASERLAGLREVLRGDRGVVPEDAASGFRPPCKPAPPLTRSSRSSLRRKRVTDVLTGGQVAALIAAVAFALLMLALTYVVLKLSKTVEETQRLVAGLTDKTVPLLGEVTTSVTHVNKELVRVDAITANVQSMTGNVSALTSLFAATLGSPIIKVAAFSYGVRSVAAKRSEKDVTKRVREELKASKRSRR
jgi:uncharacterized protein YoxC